MPNTKPVESARTIPGLIGLGIVASGMYGFCDCARASSKHSEKSIPISSALVAEPPSSPSSVPTGLSEETIRGELGKMTAFFKWISSAHDAITKQKYVSPAECEKGKCSATFVGPDDQTYVVDWAKKNQRAQSFRSSFKPVKVACGDIDGRLIRTWNYGGARKILCKANAGGNVLIEMNGGALQTTKFLVYTDVYLTIDPAFAEVVRNEGR